MPIILYPNMNYYAILVIDHKLRYVPRQMSNFIYQFMSTSEFLIWMCLIFTSVTSADAFIFFLY